MQADVALVFEVEVRPEHIDELGHVNNVVYVAWAQEAGVRHWRSKATPEMLARFVWVASRTEIDYLRESLLGERLRVETWLGDRRGARFDRHVRILGADDGTERARALTTWALVDASSRRPIRVPEEVSAIFAPGP